MYYFKDKSGKHSENLIDFSSNGIDLNAVATFLHYGYLFGNNTLVKDVGFNALEDSPLQSLLKISGYYTLDQFYKNIQNQKHFEDCYDEASKCWDDIFSELLAQNSTKKMVVPISGGLDSRAILAALLERIPSEDIQTYTFGTPGSLDYEIGNIIAKKMGCRHIAYDLTQIPFSEHRLLTLAKLSQGNSDLFSSPPLEHLLRDFDSDSMVWTGYMGDPSMGSHIPAQSRLDAYKSNYINEKENYSGVSHFAQKVLIEGIVTKTPWVDLGNPLEFHVEKWDLLNRQYRYVTSQVFFRPFQYASPFVDDRWLKFAFSLPHSLRKDQYFYKLFLLKKYPKIFRLPVKNDMGVPLGYGKWHEIQLKCAKAIFRLSRRYHHAKMVNYIDFATGLRNRQDLIDISKKYLKSFSSREFVNSQFVNSLIKKHHKGEDYSRSITLFISLELILRNNNL